MIVGESIMEVSGGGKVVQGEDSVEAMDGEV